MSGKTLVPGVSVFARGTILIAVAIAIVASVLTVQSWRMATGLAQESVATMASRIGALSAEQLAGAIRFGRVERIEADLETARSNAEGLLAESFVFDPNGEILAAAAGGAPGDDLRRLAADALARGEPVFANGGLDAAHPVLFGDDRAVIGAFVSRWTTERQRARIEAVTRHSLLVALGVSLVVIYGGALLLRQTVSMPLRRVGQAMGGIGAGDYKTVIPALRRRDEIGRIARDLDQFRMSLEDAEAAARVAAYQSAGFLGSSAALLMTDRSGNIRFTNPAFAKLLEGIPESPLRADQLEGRLASEIDPSFANLTGESGAESDASASRDIRLSGRDISVDVNGISDSSGTPIGYVLEFKDVTDARMNDAVLDSLDRNQVRAEFDLDGKLVSVNTLFEGMIGHSSNALQGRHIDTILCSTDDRNDRRMVDLANATEARFGKFRIARDGADPAILDGGLCPVNDRDGRARRFVLIGTDITDAEYALLQAEEKRKAMEEAQKSVVEVLRIGLKRLSSGDLTFVINDPFDDDYETLRQDYNAAISGLNAAMADVVELSRAMRNEVLEITSSSDELSRRTEKQAATLEETAAALTEITSAVTSAAEGAKLAGEVVDDATKNASTSGEVVREAVCAMDEISTSSEKISRIIGVIDDIAFQTNLLALNAGVEAARAGEAGRGFAVVASEVRALAQRSSDAAREINDLITSSGQTVERGVSLVGEAGRALEGIAASVSGISEHVMAIVASSSEQSVSLSEVNSAVGHLDEATQKNAAMFEETTAASHALMRQAETLNTRISQFTIRAASTETKKDERPKALSKLSQAADPATRGKPAAISPGSSARQTAPADDVWEDF